MEGNSSCIIFTALETAGFAYGFIMILYIFQEVANGGMKGYEWEGKKRLLGGQEVADVKMNVKSVR